MRRCACAFLARVQAYISLRKCSRALPNLYLALFYKPIRVRAFGLHLPILTVVNFCLKGAGTS